MKINPFNSLQNNDEATFPQNPDIFSLQQRSSSSFLSGQEMLSTGQTATPAAHRNPLHSVHLPGTT
jgi:hypothetical protein